MSGYDGSLRITRCQWAGDGWLVAWQTYEPLTFERCRSAVHRLGRGAARWLPEEKAWWIRARAFDELRALIPELDAYLCDRLNGRMNGRNGRQSANAATTAPGDALALLYLTPDAPLCVVKAAYRALAKQLHPDHTGQTGESDQNAQDAMKRLNLAYEVARAWAEARDDTRAA